MKYISKIISNKLRNIFAIKEHYFDTPPPEGIKWFLFEIKKELLYEIK